MRFEITELNGSGSVGSSAVCQYGVEMISGSGTSISANVWDITLIHAVTSARHPEWGRFFKSEKYLGECVPHRFH